jgi:hypothetical protein
MFTKKRTATISDDVSDVQQEATASFLIAVILITLFLLIQAM